MARVTAADNSRVSPASSTRVPSTGTVRVTSSPGSSAADFEERRRARQERPRPWLANSLLTRPVLQPSTEDKPGQAPLATTAKLQPTERRFLKRRAEFLRPVLQPSIPERTTKAPLAATAKPQQRGPFLKRRAAFVRAVPQPSQSGQTNSTRVLDKHQPAVELTTTSSPRPLPQPPVKIPVAEESWKIDFGSCDQGELFGDFIYQAPVTLAEKVSRMNPDLDTDAQRSSEPAAVDDNTNEQAKTPSLVSSGISAALAKTHRTGYTEEDHEARREWEAERASKSLRFRAMVADNRAHPQDFMSEGSVRAASPTSEPDIESPEWPHWKPRCLPSTNWMPRCLRSIDMPTSGLGPKAPLLYQGSMISFRSFHPSECSANSWEEAWFDDLPKPVKLAHLLTAPTNHSGSKSSGWAWGNSIPLSEHTQSSLGGVPTLPTPPTAFDRPSCVPYVRSECSSRSESQSPPPVVRLAHLLAAPSSHSASSSPQQSWLHEGISDFRVGTSTRGNSELSDRFRTMGITPALGFRREAERREAEEEIDRAEVAMGAVLARLGWIRQISEHQEELAGLADDLWELHQAAIIRPRQRLQSLSMKQSGSAQMQRSRSEARGRPRFRS